MPGRPPGRLGAFFLLSAGGEGDTPSVFHTSTAGTSIYSGNTLLRQRLLLATTPNDNPWLHQLLRRNKLPPVRTFSHRSRLSLHSRAFTSRLLLFQQLRCHQIPASLFNFFGILSIMRTGIFALDAFADGDCHCEVLCCSRGFCLLN